MNPNFPPKADAPRAQKSQTLGFSGLGMAPIFLEILTKLNYKNPTPIQKQAIPIAIEGKDVVGLAQTGTGKTMTFGIPMIQRLNQLKVRGLVVLLTREPALQVDEVLRQIGASLGLKTAVLIGGMAMGPQKQAIAAELHSNRSLNQRRNALQGFKSGKYRVLVATDIASRGIDVVGIELVINYDLLTSSEDYVQGRFRRG